MSKGAGLGLAPGIQLSLEVLNPGERDYDTSDDRLLTFSKPVEACQAVGAHLPPAQRQRAVQALETDIPEALDFISSSAMPSSLASAQASCR